MTLKLKGAIVDPPTLGLRITYREFPTPNPAHANRIQLLASGFGLLAPFLRCQSASLSIAPRALELQRELLSG